MKKVLVVGAGNVGAQVISSAVSQNISAEFFLLDINEELESAQILDLKDQAVFTPGAAVSGVNFGDKILADMDVIIITAGANQAPGETRCDLLHKNSKILQSIAAGIRTLKSTAIVVIVTNPVDILTHLAHQYFDLPASQIFGTGTLLDTARLRWQLAKQCNALVQDMSGFVLGEHGDSEFVAWSTVKNSAACPPQAWEISADSKIRIEQSVRNEAYEIIAGKGATYFGIAAVTGQVLRAILSDTNELFPLSVSLQGMYGITDIAIGVPVRLGANGVEKTTEIVLATSEIEQLKKSAEKLANLYNSCPV